MENLYKLVLENVDLCIVLKEYNNIIYNNNELALKLNNLNNKLKNKIIYENSIYKVTYKKINNYDIEIYQDVSKYEKEIETLKKDYLTGLYTRYAVFEELEKIKNIDYSLVMCDIDFFKKINDQYGHLVGDYVLKGISNILKNSIDGIVGRYGGEEFIIIIPKVNSNECFDIIEKIRKKIEKTKIRVKYDDCIKEFYVTMTFGIVSSDNNNIEESIAKADKALYKGKKNGRNQTNIF